MLAISSSNLNLISFLANNLLTICRNFEAWQETLVEDKFNFMWKKGLPETPRFTQKLGVSDYGSKG
jgi:hypothetical protein